MDFEAPLGSQNLEWLLEIENPAVMYFTLIRLLQKAENDPEVLWARATLMQQGTIHEILSRQSAEGYWGDAHRFYTDKYRGTVWQLMILAELGADPDNEKVKKACRFILENSQDPESFGFAVNKAGKKGGGRRSEVIPCLTGNMVWSLICLGFLEDPRVQGGIDWICKYQRADDGIEKPPVGWPYDRFEVCFGRHSCHMGVVKSLKALAAIPKEKRNQATNEKITELTEYLLKHHIFKRSRDLSKAAKPGWLKLGFPLMYQNDILEILGILTELGYHDPRMNEALEILKNKMGPNGRWKLENTFNGKMLADIEVKGQESKWITAKAFYVLNQQNEP